VVPNIKNSDLELSFSFFPFSFSSFFLTFLKKQEMSKKSLSCAVCGVACTNRCASCHKVGYCSRKHQKEDWKRHKNDCTTSEFSSNATSKLPSSKTPPNSTKLPSAWSEGLTGEKRYEWLIDCYRLRMDDNYVNGNLAGLYATEEGSLGIVRSFLTFCKLALKNGIVPSEWDWNAFTKVAAQHLICSFEKSDAQEKYGGENVFGAAMGGRSLRFTAEQVYGTNVYDGNSVSEENKSVKDSVDGASCFRAHSHSLVTSESLFAAVGGYEIWETLLKDLIANRGE
jgi:hypothetical protein